MSAPSPAPGATSPEPTGPSSATTPADRLATLGLEPLVKLSDWPVILGCSIETVGRMKSAGRLPKPDLILGRMPRWKPATVRAWLESQGSKGAR